MLFLASLVSEQRRTPSVEFLLVSDLLQTFFGSVDVDNTIGAIIVHARGGKRNGLLYKTKRYRNKTRL